jgi:hypothetical protein
MKTNSIHDVFRHNFAIWVMGRKPGWFKPQRYVYRCLRCKWTFIVNDEHNGSVRVAADRAGQMTSAEERRRLASFVDGPCPGYQIAAEKIEELQPSNVIPMRREIRLAKTAR